MLEQNTGRFKYFLIISQDTERLSAQVNWKGWVYQPNYLNCPFQLHLAPLTPSEPTGGPTGY